ncbi:retrovirus-related pol polyprotein from transposon TNT 1-94 [Tanacetum coccineum]
MERYKARLVAKGITQKEGIEFKETFVPVANMVTFRAVIALGIHNNWLLEQWFTKVTYFLLSLNFQQSYADTSLFTPTYNGHTTALLVYVDDILLTGVSTSLLQSIKQQLRNKFIIKDLGAVHYYLDIEFLINKSGLVISQRKYALELLQHAGILEDKPIITHLDP